MRKWQLLKKRYMDTTLSTKGDGVWMHYSSDDEDSHDWVDGGWVNGTGLFGSGEWLDNGWTNGTGLSGSGEWLDGGWTNGTGLFGSGEWLDGGWTNGTGLFGSGDWLDSGWTNGTGMFGRAYSSHGDSSNSNSESWDNVSSWDNDGGSGGSWSNGSSSGGGRRYSAPPQKSRVRFPWFSLFFTIVMLGSNGWMIDFPAVFFGCICIINFIRWIKQ